MNPHLLPLALACTLTFLAAVVFAWFVDTLGVASKVEETALFVAFVVMILSAGAAIGFVLVAAWQAAL